MDERSAEGMERDRDYEILEERISYLEHLKSFHGEVLKLTRVYTSNENFTSKRCLQEIVNFIQRRFSLHLICVLLRDEITEELVNYVASGETDELESVRQRRIRDGEGVLGKSANTGETIVIGDLPNNPDARPYATADAVTLLVVPIRIRNRVAGVMHLEDSQRDRFRKEYVSLIEDIAVNIGFILENKRLYDDLKQYSEHLEKKVEEKVTELKRSEERYRTIVEHASNLILTTDPSGYITWANRTACSVLRFDREKIVGLNLSRVVKKGHMHRIYSIFKELSLSSRSSDPFRIEIVSHEGEVRIVDVSSAPIMENGVMAGAELSMQDVTDKAVIDKLKKNYMKTLEQEVVQRTKEIKDIQRASILGIANLAESIDDDTGGHIQRVRHYCRVLTEELRNHPRYGREITDEYIELIYDLSPLHDLGKVGIRDNILQKKGKLTDEEFEKMKQHTVIGARALRMAGEMIHRDSIFAIGEMIARFHHEKWNGKGYPAVDVDGEKRPLKGEEIPLCARIVALADVYDAVTSKRPYKEPGSHDEAKAIIVKERGEHFDPAVVDAFLNREAEFLAIHDRFPEAHMPSERPFEMPENGNGAKPGDATENIEIEEAKDAS